MVMNNFKIFAIFLIAVLSCSTLNARTIIVGTNATYPPYQFLDKNGKIVGLEIELIETILRNKGYSFEIKNMDFDALLASLMAKNIDLIASSMSASPDRQKKISFSNQYMPNKKDYGVGIYVKADNEDIKSLDDLTYMVVGGKIGTWATENIVPKIKEPKEFINFSGDEIFTALQTGQVDALVIATDAPNDFIKKNKDKSKAIKRVGEIYPAPGVAFGVRKNDKTLLKDINDELAKFSKDKKYSNIYKKYTK